MHCGTIKNMGSFQSTQLKERAIRRSRNRSFDIFLHKLLVKFRANGVIDKNLLLFALFDTLRTILENYVIIPPSFYLNYYVQKKKVKQRQYKK